MLGGCLVRREEMFLRHFKLERDRLFHVLFGLGYFVLYLLHSHVPQLSLLFYCIGWMQSFLSYKTLLQLFDPDFSSF